MKKFIAVCIVAAALLGWVSLASSGGGLAYSALFYRPTGTVVYSLLGDGGVDDGGVADMIKPPDMTRLPDLSPPPDMTPPIPPAQPSKNGRCLRIPSRPTTDGGRVPVDGVPVYWNSCGSYYCTFNTQVMPALCEPLKVQFNLGYKKSDCTGDLIVAFPAQRDAATYSNAPTGSTKPKFRAYNPTGTWFILRDPIPAEPIGTYLYMVLPSVSRCVAGKITDKNDVFYSASLVAAPALGTEFYAGIPKWVP